LVAYRYIALVKIAAKYQQEGFSMKKYVMNRRQFMRYLGYGGIFLASQPLLSACRSFINEQPTAVFEGEPDLEIRLTAKPGERQIFPAGG